MKVGFTSFFFYKKVISVKISEQFKIVYMQNFSH